MLRAGRMSAETCAKRQHARANGSPRGPKYWPCSYLIHGERRREIVYRCDVGRDALLRMPPEWHPDKWKQKHSDPRLVRQHAIARRKWLDSHLPIDRIDGKVV